MKERYVKVGDLIRITDWKGAKPDSRSIGTVIQISSYKPSQKPKYEMTQSLSEILWQDGRLGWILTSRLARVEDGEWKD